jgi:hypothetical protein
VVDCSDLTNPIIVGTSPTAGVGTMGISVADGYVVIPNASDASLTYFRIPKVIKADRAKFGRIKVQKLHSENGISSAGNIVAGGFVSAKGFNLTNPPVVATDATVATLIATLTSMGLLRNT